MRTSKDEYKTKEGKIIALSQDELKPKGSTIWNGYDYENQCWIYQGKLDTRTVEELKESIEKEPIKSHCWRCGKEIISDTNSIEFLYDKWISDLKPMNGVALICKECFKEHIIKAFNGLQEIELE